MIVSRLKGQIRCFSHSNIQRPRGTMDLFGNDAREHSIVEEIGSRVAKLHGFREIRTPIFEACELFSRSLGHGSDVVSKEMYMFMDKSNHALCLRPENTAGVMRAVMAQRASGHHSDKLYYYGPMFRYERPQRGRLRQFHQFGVELIGEPGPLGDVEVIQMAHRFLKDLGLSESVTLLINSLGSTVCREEYSSALSWHFSKHTLSADSQRRCRQGRFLRILDSKDPEDEEAIKTAPDPAKYRSAESNKRFNDVLSALDASDIPYKVEPSLVRGLDYYCHTTFEFVVTNDTESKAMRPSAVLAGGRYDGLAECLGYAKTCPGVGWAAGIERLCLERNRIRVSPPPTKPTVFVMPIIGSSGSSESVVQLRNQVQRLASQVRDLGITVIPWLDAMQANPGQNFNLRKGFIEAERLGCSFALFVGADELARGPLGAQIKVIGGESRRETNSPEDILRFIEEHNQAIV